MSDRRWRRRGARLLWGVLLSVWWIAPLRGGPLGLGGQGIALAAGPRAVADRDLRLPSGDSYPIEIHGNLVLNDEVYRALIDLPATAAVDNRTIEAVRDRLRSFLRRAGYTLARVAVAFHGGVLSVEVDEGRLERVIFVQQGTLRTLQLKLLLNLPHDVFNEPFLRRRLAQIKEELGFVRAEYLLVNTPKIDHTGPQVEELEPLAGLNLVAARIPRELLVHLQAPGWFTGGKLRLSINGIDGLVLAARYQSQSWMERDDRLRFDIALGGRYDLLLDRAAGVTGAEAQSSPGRDVELGQRSVVLSVAGVAAQWRSRAWGRLRPMVSADAWITGRQRLDLGVGYYRVSKVAGAIRLSYELNDGASHVSAGVGYRQRTLWRVDGAPGVQELYGGVRQGQPFAAVDMTLDLEPGELRRDQRHLLEVEARSYLGAKDDARVTRLYASHRKTVHLGWHDVVVHSRAVGVFGEPLISDVEPVGGRHVRGAFSNMIFAKRVISVAAELRMSIARDIYKLSVYHDLAAYDRSAEGYAAPGGYPVRLANSFGLGFHALLFGAFQLDIYYGWGFASQRGGDRRPSLRLRQAF